MFVVWAPNQYDLLHRVDTDLTNQGEIEGDLDDLADSGAFEPLCGPISVPNHRAVPRLAFDLDIRPTQIVSSRAGAQPRRGYFLDPASPFVVHNFVLDPNDPTRFATPSPRLPPRRRATSPGSSTAAADATGRKRDISLSAAHRRLLPRSTASTGRVGGGELGVGELDRGGSSTCRSLEGSRRARSPPRASRARGRRGCGPRR